MNISFISIPFSEISLPKTNSSNVNNILYFINEGLIETSLRWRKVSLTSETNPISRI